QHAIQDIEGFGFGEKIRDSKNYYLRHGEVEARNVQGRLDLDARAYAKIKGGEFYSGEKEIQAELANDKEYQKALREFQKSLDKDSSKSDKEWEIHENLRVFLTQRERQVEAKYERSEPFTIEQGHLPHPYKTMDTPLKDTIAEATMQGEALSKELESSFLDSSGKIDYKALMDNAEALPQTLNLKGFKDMIFKNDKTKRLDSKNAVVQTPAGEVKVNVLRAFNHYKKNGKYGNHKENRQVINATFMPTLLKPKFVTKDEEGTLYYYKPFINQDKKYHITSIAVKTDGTLEYATSYNATKNRLNQMIKYNELVFYES
ncbi:hypothetical protein, partial [Helicobacter bilis]